MIKDHPTKDIVGQLSNQLEGKKIILAMTGSVAIIKAVELARLLIRHGAEVIPVMSLSATELIQPPLLEWATGNSVITQITGSVEHVIHAGNTTTKSDLMLVYPATANTLSKIANGIDDTTVTTFATTAIGEEIPVVVVPAMHQPMYHHPAVKRNIAQLQADGVQVLEPQISEGKAKVKEPSQLCEWVLQTLNQTDSNPDDKRTKKKILITGGKTFEPIDSFRGITNRSSGKMAAALAKAALKTGAEVTLISGEHSAQYPEGIKLIQVETTEQMLEAVHLELETRSYDIFIGSAAVSDWKPQQIAEGKISTQQRELKLTLVPTPKIVDTVKTVSPRTQLVLFRALANLTKEEMIQNGEERLKKANGDLICINSIGEANRGFNADTNELILIDKANRITEIPLTTKTICAEKILSVINQLD